MKKAIRVFLATVICVVTLIPAVAMATPSSADQLIALGMHPAIAKKLVEIVNNLASPFANNTYMTVRNAANSGNINMLKVDGTDDTVLNADTGDVIKLSVAGTSEVQVDNDSLTFTGASAALAFGATSGVLKVNGNTEATLADDSLTLAGASFKFIPGATSLLFRNNADSASNLSITDAGVATFRGDVVTTGLQVPSANFETVAGAGTTVSDAAALSVTKHIHQLTGANGTVGWKFASSTAGQVEILLNTTAGVPKVYAVSGGTCNGGAADAACTLVTGIVAHVCYATAANAWICS